MEDGDEEDEEDEEEEDDDEEGEEDEGSATTAKPARKKEAPGSRPSGRVSGGVWRGSTAAAGSWIEVYWT